jgi:hypothetical protein
MKKFLLGSHEKARYCWYNRRIHNIVDRYASIGRACTHTSKYGNGQGMGRVEQYNTHAHIVDGYKILPIPVPMGIKLYPYPYPYPTGTHTHWVPNE